MQISLVDVPREIRVFIFLAAGPIKIHHCHASALTRENIRTGSSQAATRSGDQRDLAFEKSFHRLIPCAHITYPPFAISEWPWT